MNVSICESGEPWDRFVESMPQASNYHRWVWRRVIEDTFGHRSYYLTAGNGTIDGVLPLVFIDSWLFGKFLVSIPFFSYGGVLPASDRSRAALLSAAVQMASELNARHIELRQVNECRTNFLDTTQKVTMDVTLPATVEELWKRFSPQLRNKIRAGHRSGLRAQWGGSEALEDFYRVFAINMRNLGTPVYPLQWFRNICRHESDAVRILTVWLEHRPVAAAFLIRSHYVMELPWSASTPEARKIHSTRVMYCALLERAIEEGCHSVDLGRCTKGSGTYQFKLQWGSRERPLHWYYWLAPGIPLPEIRHDNPRFALATRLWKHMPLSIANRLGPQIVRSLP